MSLPLSQLVYDPFRVSPTGPRVVTLHRYGVFADSMKDIGLAVSGDDGTCIGLQSSKGVHSGRTIVGYTWFVGPLHQTSPIHFGESLADIERFLWDEIDRQESEDATLPMLVGLEQGAAMTLAVAAAVPDLLSGVVAIDPVFPVIPGWDPPLAPLDDLPVMLVNPVDAREQSGLVTGPERLTSLIDGWGGHTSVLKVSEDLSSDALGEIRKWIENQPIRSYVKEAT